MNPISILLAEDHTIVRKGLLSLLNTVDNFKVLAEAEDGREAVTKVEALKPDIVVMDISMPHLNGLEATRQIKKRFPKTKVIILTMHTNEEYIFEILRAGASGYIVKKAAPEELIMAIQAVSQGEKYFSPSISTKIADELLQKGLSKKSELTSTSLTGREREVLQLIAEGHTNREIAELLFISLKTVEAHRSHIMDKLDLHNAAELTKYAIQKGIISSEDE